MTAQEIREMRLGMGISQLALANILGITRATVCSWETGKTKPSLLLAFKLRQLDSHAQIPKGLDKRVSNVLD